MNNLNRTEEKKLKKMQRRERGKHFIIIMFCIVLFISMIYITDASTSKMMQKSDDKYAIYVKYEKNGTIRIDIAGETIRFYLKPLFDLLKSFYKQYISFVHVCIAFYSHMYCL